VWWHITGGPWTTPLPRDASFLAELEAELLVFPQGRNDDQVDSITQALAYDPLAYDISMRWV
jgi:phage terminase large subunit-like protein